MFTRKKVSKTVIGITDTAVSYITLSKDQDGFFVHDHGSIDVPEGTILRGEILKVDSLHTLLKKIADQMTHTKIDVVIDHNYFTCTDAVLEPDTHTPIKKRVQEYFKNNTRSEPWHKTHICEFSMHTIDHKERVLFKCIPKDIQKSYMHVCTRAGFTVESIQSNILAYAHLLNEPDSSLVVVGDHMTRVVDFKSGMYSSHKTFQVSYSQLTKDIEKHISVNPTQATGILDQYGVLRSHKEERVYTRLLRSLSPLSDFLTKRKKKPGHILHVVFSHKPIPGFVDHIAKVSGQAVSEFDVLSRDAYVFHDVLSLHRNESYLYQSLVAQALTFWGRN